ncbi:MAG: aminoacyl-histidine dipeptidase [Spirochaetales bacterium]|nr:aminoacyl-histidine dipeptidase [Spirochaetales bacterium]
MTTLDYFYQICRIPRESGNEEGMRQYLLAWAKENGFEGIRDKAGNIIVRTEATPGYENVPYVALQSHMDMVCVKVEGSKHNFLTDPIEVYQDGDFLRAKDTSLGGDNGIGVAMTMALFTDPDVKHGPLEGLFTFSEETGMDGAYNLDGSLIRSKRMLNLDSEEEGIIYIGCAGGIDLVGNMECETSELPVGWETMEIRLSGLKGGHSGGEIHNQRLNAISALARILVSFEDAGIPFRISSLNGGTKRNVIPFSAECSICVPVSLAEKAAQQIQSTYEVIKEENRYEEPGFEIMKRGTERGAQMAERAMDEDISLLIAKALFACPHGVFTYSKAIPGIVETSDNLAIVHLNEGRFSVQISVRSNSDTAKLFLVNRIRVILESFGVQCEIGNGYPAWNPDPDSALARFCAEAYESITGKKPVITAIHAGLECSVINSKCPGLDSVSIGPEMYDIHSTGERLSISSTNRTYDFVKHLLGIIR